MLPRCVFKACAKASIQDIATWYVSMKIGVLVRHWLAQKLDHTPKLSEQPLYPEGMEEILKPCKDKANTNR